MTMTDRYGLAPLKYQVNTDVFESGLIEQSISYGGVEPLARFIMDTRDEQIRAALIKLGWTPPVDSAGDKPRPLRKCGVCGAEGDADHAGYCSESW